MIKRITILFMVCIMSFSISAQTIEVTRSRKAVRTSGDVGAVLLPVAGLTAILINKDWQGLKQGVFAGITTLGVTTALKYAVKKERGSIFHTAPLRMEMGGTGIRTVNLCRLEPSLWQKARLVGRCCRSRYRYCQLIHIHTPIRQET